MHRASTGPATPGTPAPAEAVVQALVENHRRFLAFVEPRVRDRATAEEILQAAFVRGLERAGEVRDEERAVAWFYRLLRNAVVDHYRSRGTEAAALEAFGRELGDGVEPPPEIARELCACFEALLPALRPEYAEILRRVDLAGERPADVARALGLTANNSMVRLHRARKALRTALERSCRTCAEHGCLDCTCRAGVRVEDRLRLPG